MERIQKMVAVVALAEKAEREKDEQIQKAILGYDAKVWLEIDAQICDMGQADQLYSRIALPPPVKGKHKYRHCSHLYSEIHKFIGNRECPPLPPPPTHTQQDNIIGGTT